MDLNSMFELTNMGKPSKIVSIEITQEEGFLTIKQTGYIESILKQEGMEHTNSVKTSLNLKQTIEPNPEGNKGNKSNPYARLIGSLQYLATATCPDIVFAVNRLSAFTANPSMSHQTAAKCILRYLSGTKNLSITYRKTTAHENNNLFHGYHKSLYSDSSPVHGYADAAFVNNDKCHSTSGYICLYGSRRGHNMGVKKQTTIALLLTEAEYMALSEAARKAKWLRNLYVELGFQTDSPIPLFGDNRGALKMAINPQFHRCLKHIKIWWHWIREQVEEKDIANMQKN